MQQSSTFMDMLTSPSVVHVATTSNTQWGTLRPKRVSTGALVHSGGARAYVKNPPGILQDGVCRGKKRQYTKTTEHHDFEGKAFKSKGGTQCLDGWFQHGKRAVGRTNARFSRAVTHRLRQAQWRNWIGNRDRWVAAGEVISWVP